MGLRQSQRSEPCRGEGSGCDTGSGMQAASLRRVRLTSAKGTNNTLRRFGSQSEAMQGRDSRREASSGELRAMHGRGPKAT